MYRNQLTERFSQIAAGLAILSAAPSSFAQEINVGEPCGEFVRTVDQVTAAAVDPTWLQETYLPHHIEEFNYDDDIGWTVLGGFGDAQTQSTPFYRMLIGSLLPFDGVTGQQPSVRSGSSGFEYDPDGFYVTPNFNRSRTEYRALSSGDSYRACQDVDANTGGQRCSRNVTRTGFLNSVLITITTTYGQKVSTQLERVIDGDPTTDGSYSGKNADIRYSCTLMDQSRGSVKAAEVIAHENWHGMPEPDHVDCAIGKGRCAGEWDFDIPRHSRTYNSLADNTSMDAYQVSMQFMCDVTDSAADWVPIMTQQVMNAEANRLGGQNRFQNIRSPIDNSIVGTAPISCGLPNNVLRAGVGTLCTTTGTLRCNVDTDCDTAAGETCENACCFAPVIVK